MSILNELYITGTKQKISVHSKSFCSGENCSIHNPSDHAMKDFPNHWNHYRRIIERVCPHGIHHPDPDDRTFNDPYQTHYAGKWAHGCDGCCLKVTEKISLDEDYID